MISRCQRCLLSVRVDPNRNPDALILRKSLTPEGFCINCAATHWQQHGPEPIRSLCSPEALTHPQIQQQFGRILQAAHSDARIDEINWPTVVENWSLPFTCTPVGMEGFRCKPAKPGA
jgi:hypothetical protein